MTAYRDALLNRIKTREARVGVVGLGYVGLPLAVGLAQAGFRVLGVEISTRKAQAINAGESYVGDVPAAEVAAVVQAGRLSATTDFGGLVDCDAVSICVPTPLSKTHEPDLSYVISAVDAVARQAHPRMLVVLESTTYPGTTDEIVVPRITAGGLTVGQDVFIAFSPERVDPGRQDYTLRTTPKVLGGVTPDCLEVATALYGSVVDRLVPVSSTAAAEMVKLLENTFRAVNIALVNEVLLMCEKLGLNAWEIIDAAATKPYGFMKFTPGPGVGGHCLAGTEWVRFRWGAENGVLPIELLYRRALRRSRRLFRHLGGAFVSPKGLEVLSINPDSGTQSWKTVSYLFEREYQGTVVDVTTRDNRRMTVTDRHPMLVHAPGGLLVREAHALQPGDLVPLVHQPPADASPEPSRLNLLAWLPDSLAADVRVRHPQGWEHARSDLRSLLGDAARDAIRNNSLPLAAWRQLPEDMRGQAADLLLVTGRGPSHSSFPAEMVVDESFARLLGYYLSEGCISQLKAGRPRLRFTFHRQEKEYLADVRALLARWGLRVSTYNDPAWPTTTLKVGGWLLPCLFRDWLRTGVDASSMRVPDVVMGAAPQVRQALLVGLFRGDGDVHIRSGTRRYRKEGREYTSQDNAGQVGYFSSSPELLEQVGLLLQESGLTPHRKANRPWLRFYAPADLERLGGWFLGVKARRLEQLMAAKKRRSNGRRPRVNESYAVSQIRSVTPRQAHLNVYSVEVHGTHTFAASTGIFVHNCIPLDPQYLSWKLRTLNYNARFIQLAEEINLGMPGYWVNQAAEALNRERKALNGSRVLVLGVAYKPDVDDVRESPALDILEQLQARGAQVSFHDPYVTSLEPEGLSYAYTALSAETLQAQDCVMIVTDHRQYDWAWVRQHARLIIDTRNALTRRPAGL